MKRSIALGGVWVVFALANAAAGQATGGGGCPCNVDVAGSGDLCGGSDGAVNILQDVMYVRACVQNQANYCGDPMSICDVNCDGAVNFCDVMIVLSAFAKHPDPCSIPCGACCNLDLGGGVVLPCGIGAEGCPGYYQGDGTTCQPSPCDCQPNGIVDSEDIAAGTSEDCDSNGQPDECEEGACCFFAEGQMNCSRSTTEQCDAPEVNGDFLGVCAKCPGQRAELVTEPGGDVFIHIIGPPVECPTEGGGIAAREICEAPWIDAWVSQGDGGTMCHNFGSASTDPIPADFFDAGSDPFNGVVCLTGVPLGPTEYGDFGDADTLIARADDPFDQCTFPSTAESTVEIEIVALSLVSIDPMTVTYNGGQDPEQWDVAVDRSPSGALPETPPSTLTAVQGHCNGGTYVSTLYVQPQFTFTKVGDPGQVRVLDTYDGGTAPVQLDQQTPLPWATRVDPNLGATVDLCTDFHPGIEDIVPVSACDCNNNTLHDICEIEAGTVDDCNENLVPDVCDVDSGSSLDCTANGVPDECEPDCNGNGAADNCDIANGSSQDTNGDGIPDECECSPSSQPQPEMIVNTQKQLVVSTKNRYLSFAVGDPGVQQSIMVKFNHLPGPYSQFDGNCMWVGTPFQVTESPARTDPGQPGFADFWAAKLQCEKPAPMDFTTLAGDCRNGVCYHSENAGATCTDDSECVRAILHVYGDYVVPSSLTEQTEYDVRVLASDCPQDQINNPAVAGSLIMNTSLWGDVCGPFVNGQWTAADGQFLIPHDVMSVLWKFALGPLSKTRADVVSTNPTVDLSPDREVSITSDVIRVLQAGVARGFPYQSPFEEFKCPSGCAVKGTAGMASRR